MKLFVVSVKAGRSLAVLVVLLILLISVIKCTIITIIIIIIISNGNRTEWSTNNLKLRARLPLNCTTRSPITN